MVATPKRTERLAQVALAALLVALIAAGPVAAKKKKVLPVGPVISTAILVHNGGVGAQQTIALQASQAYNDCLTAQSSGDQVDWDRAQGDGNAVQQIVSGDLRPYNQRLEGWINAIESVKAHSKSRRRLKQQAVESLTSAQSGHGIEFFNLDGVGNKVFMHDCQGAHESLIAASHAGDPAWLAEFEGLVHARALLHLKGHANDLSPQVTPWADAGVR
jgi:hypothetical protein